MNSIVAKFECRTVSPSEHDAELIEVSMTPAVYGPENETWAYYTPSGLLQLGINANVPAATFCKPGKSYKVTIEELPE